MSATTKNTKKTKNLIEITPQGNEETAVLYQKLGSKWYAFSLVDEEVFIGAIDPSLSTTPVEEKDYEI